MNWYLIQTKPKQEISALHNLKQQGYTCYLPTLLKEHICRGSISIKNEPLFPRYLFIQLETGDSARSWGPIRSTRGVSSLVSFGTEPAKVDIRLIDLLKGQERAFQKHPKRLFSKGDCVKLTEGAFADIEGVYQMDDGESRVLILIEFLNKQVHISVSPSQLRKVV